MSRVTSTEVKEIIDTDLDNLNPHITAASLLVDKINGVSASEKKEIERWLAAHFVAIHEPRANSESAEGLSQNFGFQRGLGLDQTTYGQQAKALDGTGTLASMEKKKASIKIY